MNVRIVKEIRPLLPAFALTLFGLMLTVILPPSGAYWGIMVSAFGYILVGVTTFGDEFGNRTMPLLLSQPFSRQTIWREKMTALAVAIGILLVVALICTYQVGQFISPEIGAMVAIVLVFGLGVFCTTPFWTLCVKNVSTAVAVSLGGPFALALITIWILNYVPALNRTAQAAVLLLPQLTYFFVCYRAGRATFLNLQELDIQSPEVALPAGIEQALVRPFKSVIPRFTGPWSSLINKELHLQRVIFLFAFLFCILVPLEYLAWKLMTWETGKEIAVGTLGATFVIYVILVPLIAGAGCVAEEKNWKIHEWHLTLPPSKLKQWCVKVLVTLTITVTLGIFLPSILLAIVRHWDPGYHWNPEFIYPALLLFFVACLGIFASSVSTNSMRAIILTIALVIMGIAAIVWGHVAAIAVYGYFASDSAAHLELSDSESGLYMRPIIINAVLLTCATCAFILCVTFLDYRTGASDARRGCLHAGLILAVTWAASVIFTYLNGFFT